MTFDAFGEMNWAAVVVAAVAYYALGGLWFAEFAFYPAWRRSMGWEKRPLGASYYVGPFVTSLLTAVALGALAEATGSSTFGASVVLGLVVGLGVAAAVIFNTGALDPNKPRPLTWFGVTGGYHLVGTLIASAVVTLWR